MGFRLFSFARSLKQMVSDKMETSSPYAEMIVKIFMIFAGFERKSIIEGATQAYAHGSK